MAPEPKGSTGGPTGRSLGATDPQPVADAGHRLPAGPAAPRRSNNRLRERLGPLLGFDNPKLVPLGGERTLWLLTDPYVDLSGTNNGPLEPHDYVHNTLLLQDGACFSLVQRVQDGLPWEFAPSRSDRDWYWPIGGSIGEGGLLYIFWSRMVEDGAQAFLDGITRHPIETWLGVYDPTTFATIRFEWAPNSDVFPQYGSAVQTSPTARATCSATRTCSSCPARAATEPDGRSPARGCTWRACRPGGSRIAPTYWTGSGWSASAAAARPISSRWSISNAMQPG